MQTDLILSKLSHTWILDIDGTLCVHNGYRNGEDIILEGVKDFFKKIPKDDMIILLTSRTIAEKNNIDKFMKSHNLRYDHIICDAPMGERILINDDKPSGLKMSYSINKKRDDKFNVNLIIDERL